MGKARRTALPSPRGDGKQCLAARPRRNGRPAATLYQPLRGHAAASRADWRTVATLRARATAASRQRPAGGLARQHEAGAAQRRRGISRCANRSADCCRDCPPLPTRPARQRQTLRQAPQYRSAEGHRLRTSARHRGPGEGRGADAPPVRCSASSAAASAPRLRRTQAADHDTRRSDHADD